VGDGTPIKNVEVQLDTALAPADSTKAARKILLGIFFDRLGLGRPASNARLRGVDAKTGVQLRPR